MEQRIKIFFVTYKEPTLLNETLESFFETGGGELCNEVTIINNHSDFYLKKEFLDKKLLMRAHVHINKFKPEITINNLDLSNHYGTIGETIYSGNLKNSMLYPYFECDITERHLKNYMN